jgi:hypothetical protein
MDVTVVATGVIAAVATVAGASVGLVAGKQQRMAEDRRQFWLEAQRRRDERRAAYRTVLDLITDWQWDTSYPPADYDLIASFTKPFVHAANDIRVYGSEDALRAVDKFQRALARRNALDSDARPEVAEATQQDRNAVDGEIWSAFEELVNAARADVGPTREDLSLLAMRSKSAPTVAVPRA